MINYDKVYKYIQAHADFIGEGKRKWINCQQSHRSQVIKSYLVNVVAIVVNL